jgi:hypothetical protein
MNATDIAWWRMHNLGLNSEPLDSPEDVVRWLGAVQAQEFGPAKWSVAQRTLNVDEAEMERLVDEGWILRTHLLRPTWHFVHPEDIRLLLQVTGPRVQASNGSVYRNYGLDELVFDRCNKVIVDALGGGNHLTRKELGKILSQHGIEALGARLAGIMMNAELEAVICSGELRGKQQTYALLEERAPNARRYDPDEALVEVIRRYFASHGPATIKDCRSWGSLKIADIRRGIQMLGDELQSFELDGLTYWYVHGPPEDRPELPDVHLLQGYDEYFMGYLESRGLVDTVGRLSSLNPDAMIANGSLVIDSQVAGHWRRKVTGSTISFEILHYDEFDDVYTEAIQREADRFGEFHGLGANVALRQI